MILEIFRDSFEYAFKDVVILKLGLLTLLSILIIPLFILAGYSYRTIYIGINSMINKNNRKPKFNCINEMLIQGLKTIIIIVAYNLPSMIITYATIQQNYLFTIVRVVGESKIDFNLEVTAFLAIIWFVSLLFTIVAIPNMIDNGGSLKSGFNIKKILTIIKSVGILNYIKFSLTSLIIYIGTIIFIFLIIQLIISFLINYGIFITGIGTIVLYFLIFLFLIVPMVLLSQSRAISLIYNMK